MLAFCLAVECLGLAAQRVLHLSILQCQGTSSGSNFRSVERSCTNKGAKGFL